MNECVYCGEKHPLLKTHHMKEHPGREYNPVWYWGDDSND